LPGNEVTADADVNDVTGEHKPGAHRRARAPSLAPAQVGLGLPASPSAATGGYVSPSVVNDALDCLAAKQNCGSFVPPTTWPGIRGVMTWSINWDASNGYNFANTVAPHLTTLP
jgi:chitinase